MSEQLKPCPFCGAEADTFIVDNIVNVGCPECHIRTRYESLDNVQCAVDAWNKRQDESSEQK